jgi:predicted deacylase
MDLFTKKNKIIFASVLIVILVTLFFVFRAREKQNTEVFVREEAEEVTNSVVQTLGVSAEDREIKVVTFGNGEKSVLFVGGMHGGYEWNSVYAAYKFIDYFDANPDSIPKNVSISIIPSINPDGLYKVVGSGGRFAVEDVPATTEETVPGRFNANEVDLNRNFDCKWQPESTWRGNKVSAGSRPFSEKETSLLRDFVLENKPESVIFWHSKGGAVYASECENGILPETIVLMNTYSEASDYLAIPKFDAYEVTGDAEGWLASIGIPAITVEFSTHERIDWEQNLSGVKAILSYYEKL